MTYTVSNYAGAPAITNHDTSQKVPLLTKVFGWDPTYGEGEFIYLIGVANTVVGNLVTFNALTAQTTLAPNTAGLAQPVAVAMSACVAAEYGWYQIKGAAVIKKTSIVGLPDARIFISSTAGRITTSSAAGTSGKGIWGARTANAATVVTTTSTIVVTIEYPHYQGKTTGF